MKEFPSSDHRMRLVFFPSSKKLPASQHWQRTEKHEHLTWQASGQKAVSASSLIELLSWQPVLYILGLQDRPSMRLRPVDCRLVPSTAARSSLWRLGLERQRDWQVSEQADWSLALHHRRGFVIEVLWPHCRALTVYQLEVGTRVGETGHWRHVDRVRHNHPILLVLGRMRSGMEWVKSQEPVVF